MKTNYIPARNIKSFIRFYFPVLFALLQKVKKKVNKKRPHANNRNYHAGFKPYQVKMHQPPGADRKKILHVICNFWTGGSARLVIDLVEHLGHLYEQKIITYDVPEIPAYTGVPVIVHKETGNPEAIRAELESFKPVLVHVHYLGHHKDEWGEQDWKWYDYVFKGIEAYGCKVVENINIPTEPYTSGAVSHYVYVSRYVNNAYSRAEHNNVVIYPGSDFTHFNRTDYTAIPDNCIGMVYRLERDKINEKSIDVFIEVVRRRKGTKALIVGGGSLLDYYRKAVAEAGLADAFTFTGYVAYEDLQHFYKKISVFVAPVHNESFGQVTPFAMNMGIPVAGYRVGALPEIIADDSLLVPPGDTEKLATLLIALLDNRRKRLQIGAANRARAQELFSVEAMVRSYQQIYTAMTDQA
ncbi:glycosyltransferase family 4 protein [Botryobacter ruber]|uniref:glycosyltransferase family 4 protein n=1 Tax=Botryobacter ruber TaxID=2171629 RepID=UPI000E0C8A3F|nr:glycosyltransferase family 4 protein [Botryobacter ruber]